jgi:deoxycytidine triphosphate deaminase
MNEKHAKSESPREKERQRLLDLIGIRPDKDDSLSPGILLSDVIEYYAIKYKLIEPFQKENLKPASYKLTIGNEYSVGGHTHQVSDVPPDNAVKIPPFEVAIIKTRETLNLPRFLIGRWNIQVRRAYQGLIWVGGPQVDAGWVGNLCCPIYNLSDHEVLLKYGESIAVIDFEKTTTFHEDKSKPYLKAGELPDRILFEDYQPEKLRSALSKFIIENIELFKGQVNALQLRVDQFISITFTVIAVLFAAVTLFFGRPRTPNWWDPGLLWICIISLFMSMLAWVNSKSAFQWFHGTLKVVFEFILLGLLTFATFTYTTRNQHRVDQLENQIRSLQERLEKLSGSTQSRDIPADNKSSEQRK